MDSPRQTDTQSASPAYAEPTPATAPSDADLARFEQIVSDVSRRLAKACSHLSEAEFKALVTDIALVKVRFDEVDTAHWRPLIDRIAAASPTRARLP